MLIEYSFNINRWWHFLSSSLRESATLNQFSVYNLYFSFAGLSSQNRFKHDRYSFMQSCFTICTYNFLLLCLSWSRLLPRSASSSIFLFPYLVILSIQSSNDNYVYLYHPCVYSIFSLEIGKEKQIVIYQRKQWVSYIRILWDRKFNAFKAVH